MTDWPAFCSNCGMSFNSGISVAPGVKGVKIMNNFSVCPNCGATANILNGGTDEHGNVYFLKAVYKALTEPQVSNDDLYIISEVIKKAQHKKASPKNVISELEEKSPTVSSFIELLKPKTAGDFYAMLGFILAVIIYIQSLTDKPQELPQQTINNITINQTTNQVTNQITNNNYLEPEHQKNNKQALKAEADKKIKNKKRKLMQKKSKKNNRK